MLYIWKVYRLVCEENRILPDASTTQEQALKDPEIMNEMTQRAQLVRDYCKLFLDAVVDHVDKVPYGVRYIAKRINEECLKCFPGAEEKQRTSLIGGLIFMRWILPVVTVPESAKLNEQLIEPRSRRHLVMIAKVLGNFC